MSQVVVTHDNLSARRAESGKQERAIVRDGDFKKWRRSDITKFDPFAAAVGVAVAPVAFIWWVLTKFVQLAIFVSIGLSRLVGLCLGATKKV